MIELIVTKLSLAYAGLQTGSRREDGQALVEYALIVSLIAIVAVAVLKLTGASITGIFSSVQNEL